MAWMLMVGLYFVVSFEGRSRQVPLASSWQQCFKLAPVIDAFLQDQDRYSEILTV